MGVARGTDELSFAVTSCVRAHGLLVDLLMSLAEAACQRFWLMAQIEDGYWGDHYDFCLGFRHAVADGQKHEDTLSAYCASLEARWEGALTTTLTINAPACTPDMRGPAARARALWGGAGDDVCHDRYCEL